MVLVAVLAVGVALVWGVARLGAVVVADASAQAAADATALAGALDGRAGAEDVARGNGAELVEWRVSGWMVQVVVSRHGQKARATAVLDEDEGPADPGTSPA